MKILLATKIFLGFSLILGLFGSVSIYGVTQFDSVRDQLNLVNRGLLPLNRVAAEMDTLQESASRSIESILRFDNLDRQRALLQSSRQSFVRNMRSQLQQAQATVSPSRFRSRRMKRSAEASRPRPGAPHACGPG